VKARRNHNPEQKLEEEKRLLTSVAITSGLSASGKPMFPRRVTGFGVHNHTDRVDGSRLQFANCKRVAADQLLSGKLDPSAVTAVVLIRERVYAAHLRRPRVERERDTGRVY